jgi:pseudaminic acid cytidylyltransferase
MENCLAIITARGGSKRIPRKNIKNFIGVPIIKYSIDAALNAGCFDEVMVSTDDLEIADIGMALGANAPFLRSEVTSNDFATTAEVIKEVVEAYGALGREFKYVCCIYPTAPFVTAEKLAKSFLMLTNSNAKSLVPVVKYGFPILRSFKLEDGCIKMNWPEHMTTRSQDLPPAFHDCGQFYFLKTNDFLAEMKIFMDNTIGYEMPESEVQDIDSYEDWKIAEIKYTFLLDKRNGEKV